jgi:putative (di)nucleoside polyphosphate hydrolase
MKKYRHAVSALVLKSVHACSKDGTCESLWSVLLVHKQRRNDTWQLPQGGVEEGESLSEAALRELEEEAGLRLPSVQHVSEQEYCYDFPPSFLRRHHPVNDGQILSFVVLEAPNDVVVTVDNDEIDAYLWVRPDELPVYLPREAYLTVVQSVLKEYLGKKNDTMKD